MSAKHIKQEDFAAEVLQAPGTVLVDFFAPWCGPCQNFSPVIDEVAARHPEVKVVKLNVDEAQTVAQQHDIMSIPTLMLFKNGRKVSESVGLLPVEQVESLLEP